MSEMRLYKQLGRDIAARREALRMTQAELAKKIDLARASLANIESGRQRIMVHQLYKLVGALKLGSIAELLPAAWDFVDEDAPEIAGDLSTSEQLALQTFVMTALAKKGRTRA